LIFDHFLVASDNKEVTVGVVIALISGVEPPINDFLEKIHFIDNFSMAVIRSFLYRWLIEISSHEERRIGNYFADSAWSQFLTGV
jgi:hypothetical protein